LKTGVLVYKSQDFNLKNYLWWYLKSKIAVWTFKQLFLGSIGIQFFWVRALTYIEAGNL
jgi:hypothetical protein